MCKNHPTESEIRDRIEELNDQLPNGSASLYLDRYDGPRREREALKWVLGESDRPTDN